MCSAHAHNLLLNTPLTVADDTSDMFVPAILRSADGGQRQNDPDGRPRRPTNGRSIAHRRFDKFWRAPLVPKMRLRRAEDAGMRMTLRRHDHVRKE